MGGATHRSIEGDDTVTYISIFDLISAAWRGKWIIVVLGVLGACAGLAVAWTATPIYRAEAVLAAAGEQQSNAGLGPVNVLFGLAGADLPTVASDRVEAVAVMRSRFFARRFIEKENLLPILFSEAWDQQAGEWRTADGRSMKPTMVQATDAWMNSVRSITEKTGTGLITVVVEWSDRELAAHWAASMVDLINELMRERDIEGAERSLQFLEAELARTSVVEVQQAIYRLIEKQVKIKMIANTRPEFAFKIIDPPVVPDPGQFVRPRRALLVVMGGMAGGMLGLALVFGRLIYRRTQAGSDL